VYTGETNSNGNNNNSSSCSNTKIRKVQNVSTQAESEVPSVNRRVRMEGGRWEDEESEVVGNTDPQIMQQNNYVNIML